MPVLLVVCGCAGEHRAQPIGSALAPDSTEIALARGAADALGKDLVGLLARKLGEAGPEGALAVCADSAQSRTRLHQAAGVSVRRVGTRLRNPANAPDSLERLVLARFQSAIATGGAPAETSFIALRSDGVTELRYLRPIRLQEMCLACHGAKESLAPGVGDVLAKRYPGDEATGYAAGDLRGAISVRLARR